MAGGAVGFRIVANRKRGVLIDFDSRAREWDSNHEVVERGRTIAAAIGRRVPLCATMRALDVGCGTGLLGLPLASKVGHVTCIDSSNGMLEVLRGKIAAQGIANVTAANHDVVEKGLPEGHFDLIVTSMTLHHVKDTDAILAAFAAHIQPGGWLCIADLDREDGSFHGIEVDVHHGFDRGELGRRAALAGFADVQFETAFVITKEAGGRSRDYPVFLMCARRP